MRIAVIGAGGIGGPYGASLAKAGADVTFVARGAHLTAMRENGLRIEGDRGETHIRPAQATDEITGIGTVDFVLSCVKLWDVEQAAEQIRPIVGPHTAVIPLQNGIDAAERMIRILGDEPVMGGVAFVTGTIVAPGVVRGSRRHPGRPWKSSTICFLAWSAPRAKGNSSVLLRLFRPHHGTRPLGRPRPGDGSAAVHTGIFPAGFLYSRLGRVIGSFTRRAVSR